MDRQVRQRANFGDSCADSDASERMIRVLHVCNLESGAPVALHSLSRRSVCDFGARIRDIAAMTPAASEAMHYR